jgi:hypothetical protein
VYFNFENAICIKWQQQYNSITNSLNIHHIGIFSIWKNRRHKTSVRHNNQLHIVSYVQLVNVILFKFMHAQAWILSTPCSMTVRNLTHIHMKILNGNNLSYKLPKLWYFTVTHNVYKDSMIKRIFYLFNNAASNLSLQHQWSMNCKGYRRRKWSWPNLKYICLERMRKTTINLCQDSWFPGQDLKLGPPE